MIFDGTILWLLPILVALFWIPQNVQHEAAHAGMVKYLGGQITTFWPFPSWEGGFSFAHVSYRWLNGRPSSTFWEGVLSAAPQILNTVLLTLLITIRFAFPDMSEVPATILSAFMLTNFIDGATNLATFYRREPKYSTDGWSWQSDWEFPVWSCRVGTMCWHLLFGSLILLPVFLG